MKMHLALTRVATTPLMAERRGDALILNGEALDLSGVTAETPLALDDADCRWLASDVTRDGDGLHLTLIAPYAGGDLPEELWYCDPLVVSEDGQIELPVFDLSGTAT